MAGTFEIYKDKAGEFRFRLKATNGQVIATGEGYKTKASAIEGIEFSAEERAGAKIEDLSEVSSASGGGCSRKGPTSFPGGYRWLVGSRIRHCGQGALNVVRPATLVCGAVGEGVGEQ